MTDANREAEASREADRLPRGDENQSIDHWAQHGVQEMTEREAEEQAEMGADVDPD